MSDQEFLEICRLIASRDTGGQWTDEKANAIEFAYADPRYVVSRLWSILAERWVPVQANETVWNGASRLRVAGNVLLFDFSETSEIEIAIPDGYALCRKVQP